MLKCKGKKSWRRIEWSGADSFERSVLWCPCSGPRFKQDDVAFRQWLSTQRHHANVGCRQPQSLQQTSLQCTLSHSGVGSQIQTRTRSPARVASVAMGVQQRKDVSCKRDGCCDLTRIRWHVHLVGAPQQAHQCHTCDGQDGGLGGGQHLCCIFYGTATRTQESLTLPRTRGLQKRFFEQATACLLSRRKKEGHE